MGPYHFTYDSQPSIRVVDAVAWAKGVEPVELQPLSHVVDPAALDTVLECPELTASSPYEGYAVEITGDGDITLEPRLTDATNTLVLGDGGEDGCFSESDVAEEHVCYVTFSGMPPIEPTADATVVHVGHFTRGASATSPDYLIQMETVRDPANVTELGITISDVLSEQEPPLMCFDSIDDLLQYVELESVFRFFHILTAIVEREGAVAHYHMDRDDEEAWRPLQPLFDTTVNRG